MGGSPARQRLELTKAAGELSATLLPATRASSRMACPASFLIHGVLVALFLLLLDASDEQDTHAVSVQDAPASTGLTGVALMPRHPIAGTSAIFTL